MTKISKNCTVLNLFWTVIEVHPRAFGRAGTKAQRDKGTEAQRGRIGLIRDWLIS